MKSESRTRSRSARLLSPKQENQTINEKLVAALRGSDERAFGDYYVKTIDSIIAFLKPIVRTTEDAEEIAQDVFAYIWENRTELKAETTVERYLYGIARNMALKLIRSRKVHGKFYTEQLFTAEDLDLPADAMVISGETTILAKQVLKKMPPQRRKVFELSRLEGKSYDEIAAELGISPSTVNRHITLALNDIRTEVMVFVLFLIIK